MAEITLTIDGQSVTTREGATMTLFRSTPMKPKADAMHASSQVATPPAWMRRFRKWKPTPIFHIPLICGGDRGKSARSVTWRRQ